jgi:hypothetical protein
VRVKPHHAFYDIFTQEKYENIRQENIKEENLPQQA